MMFADVASGLDVPMPRRFFLFFFFLDLLVVFVLVRGSSDFVVAMELW